MPIIDWYGDSFTYGYDGAQGGGRVPVPVPAGVAAQLPKYTIRNEGVNSSGTTKLLAGTDGVHPDWTTQMANSNADIVIIAFCLNDANSISTAQYQTNLTTIYNTAVARGKTVVFETCHKVDPSKGDPSAHAGVMRNLATSLGIGCIDLFQWSAVYFTQPQLFYTPDGYHPNQPTYTMIANYIALILDNKIANQPTPVGQNAVLYQLTYKDEFGGGYTHTDAQGLDTDNWSPRLYNTTDHTTKNYQVTTGALKVWPATGFVQRDVSSDPSLVPSGFAQKYGYIEISAKFPTSKGVVPKISLFNHDDNTGTYVPEIDLAVAYPGDMAYKRSGYWGDSSFHPTRFRMGVYPDKAPYAALPNAIQESFFGLHLASQILNGYPQIAFGTQRTWDAWMNVITARPGVSWADLNPSNGVYTWDNLDALVNDTVSHPGVDIIYTFGYVPNWVTGSGTNAPTDAAWTAFVTAIVARYKNTIKYWDLWNEPNATNFWTGTTAQMVNMARLAAPIIRNAGGIVLSPSPQGANAYQWLDGFFAAGGGQYVDVVNFHGYLFSNPENITTLIDNVRTVMTNRSQSTKELWDTENGWNTTSDPFGANDTQRSAFVSRFLTLEAAKGIKRTVWYAYDNRTYGTLYNPSGDGYPPEPAAMVWPVGTIPAFSITLGATPASTPSQIISAFNSAFSSLNANGGGTLTIPPGTYNIGSSAVSDVAFITASNLNNVIITSTGATLQCTTTGGATTIPIIIQFSNCSNINVEGITFKDTGFQPSVNWIGACGMDFTASVNKSGVRVRNCSGTQLVYLWRAFGNHHITDVYFDNISINQCYYTCSVQNDFDGAIFNHITCDQTRRCFISYGARGLDLTINFKDDSGTSVYNSNALIEIATSGAGAFSDNIKIRLTCTGAGTSIHKTLVMLQPQQDSGTDTTGHISNVTAWVNLVNTSAGADGVFYLGTTDGSGVERTTTQRYWQNIKFAGVLDAASATSWAGKIVKNKTTSTSGLNSVQISTQFQTMQDFSGFPAYCTLFTPTATFQQAGIAHRVTRQWLLGNVIGTPIVSGTLYRVPVTRPDGTTGEIVWCGSSNVAATTSYTIGAGFVSQLNLDGTSAVVTPGTTVTVNLTPRFYCAPAVLDYGSGLDLSAAYHTYAMSYKPSGVQFFFDGAPVSGVIPKVMRTGFDKMLLDLQVGFGGESGTPDGTTTTGSSNALQIDYVRCWQHVDYAVVPNASTGNPAPTPKLVIEDRVKETTTDTGTGDLALAGAMIGYQRFLDVCNVGDTFYGCIEAVDAFGNPTGAWEIGLYTYKAGNTVGRTTVHRSSNGNSLVNFGAGTKFVYLDLAATYAKTLKQLQQTGGGPLPPPVTARPFITDTAGNVIDTTATYGSIIFSDEFAGSNVNTNVWVQNMHPSAKVNYDTTTYTDTGGVVRSVLRMWAQQDPSLPNFTSGSGSDPQNQFYRNELSSVGTGGFQMLNGFIEFRAKLARGKGLFPALWLFNNGPNQQEIDIMEAYGNGDGYYSDSQYRFTDWAYTLWHQGGGIGDFTLNGGQKWKDVVNGGFPSPTPFSGTWHTWGFHWDATTVKLYFDGKLFSTYNHNGWYNQPMYIIIDGWYGFQGHTSGVPDPVNTPQGSANAMEIDWVRVWSLK